MGTATEMEHAGNLLQTVVQRLSLKNNFESRRAEPLCPLCRDLGWEIVEREERGRKVSRARPCACQRAHKLIALAKESGLPPDWLKTHTLTGMERPTEAYGAVLDRVNQWLGAYQPGQAGMLLHGRAGSGKTRMMTACLRGLILKRSLACRYYDARVFLQLLRNTYNAQSDTTEGELVESFVLPEVVALDELVVPRTDWERETMLMLVGERYKANRTLLVATNLCGEQLRDELDERLVSRLHAMTEPLLVDGPDFRQRGSAA